MHIRYILNSCVLAHIYIMFIKFINQTLPKLLFVFFYQTINRYTLASTYLLLIQKAEHPACNATY